MSKQPEITPNPTVELVAHGLNIMVKPVPAKEQRVTCPSTHELGEITSIGEFLLENDEGRGFAVGKQVIYEKGAKIARFGVGREKRILVHANFVPISVVEA